MLTTIILSQTRLLYPQTMAELPLIVWHNTSEVSCLIN